MHVKRCTKQNEVGHPCGTPKEKKKVSSLAINHTTWGVVHLQDKSEVHYCM